jgi:hypothetical protein
MRRARGIGGGSRRRPFFLRRKRGGRRERRRRRVRGVRLFSADFRRLPPSSENYSMSFTLFL